MRKIKDKFDITKHLIQGILDRGSVVSRPLDDTVKFRVESSGRVNEGVNMSRFIAGSGVNQEMQGTVVIRLERVEEMVSATEVAQPTFVAPKQLSNTIPTGWGQFTRR
jgi:hypothetical protein